MVGLGGWHNSWQRPRSVTLNVPIGITHVSCIASIGDEADHLSSLAYATLKEGCPLGPDDKEQHVDPVAGIQPEFYALEQARGRFLPKPDDTRDTRSRKYIVRTACLHVVSGSCML